MFWHRRECKRKLDSMCDLIIWIPDLIFKEHQRTSNIISINKPLISNIILNQPRIDIQQLAACLQPSMKDNMYSEAANDFSYYMICRRECLIYSDYLVHSELIFTNIIRTTLYNEDMHYFNCLTYKVFSF